LKSFSPGEMLFSEGEPCSGLFLIASGHVRIYKSSSSGREHILAVEGPGGSVAELPVFDGGATLPRPRLPIPRNYCLFPVRTFVPCVWSIPRLRSECFRWLERVYV
jgi:CRP/FNR family transcriptional regulator